MGDAIKRRNERNIRSDEDIGSSFIDTMIEEGYPEEMVNVMVDIYNVKIRYIALCC